MKKIFIATFLFIGITLSAQPNQWVLDTTKLVNNNLLNIYVNKKTGATITLPGGAVIMPSGNGGAINYFDSQIFPKPAGNYIGTTSGNAVSNYGYWNLIIGDNAGDSLDGAIGNTFLNKDAGQSARTTRHCFYVGWDAGQFDKSGDHNIGLSEDALHFNIDGRDNISMGRGAQYSHPHPVNNVNIGYNTSYYQTTGVENTAVGAYALGFPKTAYHVTAVGAYAGEINDNNTTIINSTFLGYSAGISSPYSNVICVGANTDVTANDQINIGNKIFYRNNSFEIAGNNITINGFTYHVTNTPPVGVQSTLVSDGLGNVTWTQTAPIATKSVQPETKRRFVGYLPNGQMILIAEIK